MVEKSNDCGLEKREAKMNNQLKESFFPFDNRVVNTQVTAIVGKKKDSSPEEEKFKKEFFPSLEG